MTVRAYKFTKPGGVGPFSRFSWPLPAGDRPGQWVDAGGAAPCRAGLHACRAGQLPYWIREELWLVELDGDIVESGGKLVASRGRLVEPVAAWTAGGGAAFASDCARQVAVLAAGFPAGSPPELVRLIEGYAGDAAHYAASGYPAVVAHVAATAAGDAAAGSRIHEQDSPAGRAERARQAAWMVEHLSLDA
ncbi:MAG: hypothetical protein ACRD0C_16435 [Acidimicrobiia bacterium]